MYLTIGEARRIEALDITFKRIMHSLPSECHIDDLSSLSGKKAYNFVTKLVSLRLNNVFCVSMFAIVILLAVVNMIFW